jgi:hypothetical protein
VLPLVRSADNGAPMPGTSGVAHNPRSGAAAAHDVPLLGTSSAGVAHYAMRDRLCMSGDDRRRAIRTPAWFLRDGDAPELFAKPDDRWEVNNVASRCGEVVECLQDALARYALALSAGRPLDLPRLGDALVRGLD